MSNTPLESQVATLAPERTAGRNGSNGRAFSPESRKGATVRARLSEARDGALLKLTRNATFISRRQVHLLAPKLKLDSKQKSLDWRLNRLSEIGLLEQLPAIYPFPGDVFCITRAGLQVLEFWDHGLASITSESKNMADAIQAAHFLSLNDVQISLYSTPNCHVSAWYSDREIASMNYSLAVPFAKNYDAIVQFKIDGRDLSVGIEYERAFKAEDRYKEIAKQIATEKGLHAVLYLTSAKDMIFRLFPLLVCGQMPICFASGAAFRDKAFGTTVAYLQAGKPAQCTFADFLKAIRPR
jgi:hypothetical protein